MPSYHWTPGLFNVYDFIPPKGNVNSHVDGLIASAQCQCGTGDYYMYLIVKCMADKCLLSIYGCLYKACMFKVVVFRSD